MNIQPLINYLRFTRRSEEAEAKSKHFLAVAVDKNYTSNNPFHEDDLLLVSKTDIQSQTNYKNISDLITDDLYFIEESSNQYKYYIKREQEVSGVLVTEYSQITSIITNVWETLTEQNLYKVTFDSVPNLYFSDVSNTIIEVYLKEIIPFQDTFKYHPNDITEMTNGEYQLDFKDAEGYTNSSIDYFFKGLANSENEFLKSQQKRIVNFVKNTRPGIVTSFPRISQRNNKYILQYNYYAKGIPAQSFLVDNALYLEFNYVGAMMAFLNQTLFYTLSEKSDFEGHKHRDPFLTAYLDLIESHIYYASLTEALEILFFAPAFVIKELQTDFLWHLIDKTLNSSLTNFQGINKEDIVVKILEVLSQKEGLENKILTQLLAKHPSGKTRLELLYDKIDGDNFLKFIKLIWSLWKKSKYSNIDPEINTIITEKSPVILDYRSDKTMGFHHDNASINWDSQTNTIDVKLEVGTGEIEIYQGKDPNGGFTTKTKEKTEKHHYNYHPFSPMVIFNADNPSFIFKDEEQNDKPYMVLPAFILLARKNKAFWENWLTAGEYFIDIITTASGVANLLKVGRLYKILKAGKSLIGKTKTFTKAVTLAKGVAGVAEISSGSMNVLLKLTGIADTELGKEISKYLFYFEMMSLSGEVSVALYDKLQKSAKKLITNKDELLKNLKEQGVDDVTKSKILNEINQIANSNAKNSLLDDFMELRAKYFNTSVTAFNKLIKESLELNHLGKTELFSLYNKHLKQFPNLAKGHNQAIFKIKFFENGKLFDQVEEFSLSGDKIKMFDNFGNPPKFPPNTVNVLNDFEEFETFVTGAYDLFGRSRKFDSEIKFIYNFLKNHAYKADEFIIETSNIFKTCGSCSREFVLLKQLLENQGKKLTIIVKADERIEGFSKLKEIYPEIKKLK